MPLERDEGEYAYIGEMMLKGIAPFKAAYSMKLPGTSFMYYIIMFLFGRTSNGIHEGLNADKCRHDVLFLLCF